MFSGRLETLGGMLVLPTIVFLASCMFAIGQNRGPWWSDEPQLLTDVTFGNGTFVAIGNDLTIMSSQNGTDWFRQSANVINPFIGINYSFETYRAGGDAVTVVYPGRAASLTYSQLRAVCFGGQNFVIVGDAGSILTSSTGEMWSHRRSGTMTDLNAVSWGNGRFVAVGKNGIVLVSKDGVVWSQSKSPTEKDLRGVAFGDCGFVAVGEDSAIVTSVDGEHWTTQRVNWLASLQSIASGNGRYVVIGEPGVGLCMYSEDGRAWLPMSNPSSSKVRLTHAGGRFACATRYGRPIFLEPSQRWNAVRNELSRDFASGYDLILAVTHGNGMFVSVGSRIETSKDALTWHRRSTPPSRLLWGCLWKDGEFVPYMRQAHFGRPGAGRWPFPLHSADHEFWYSDSESPIDGMVHGNARIFPPACNNAELAVLGSEDGMIWRRLRPGGPLNRAASFVAGSDMRKTQGLTVTSPSNTTVNIELNGKSYALDFGRWDGTVCYVQASTNLDHWVEIGVLTNSPGNLSFKDPESDKYPMRFYRLMLP